MIKYFCDVCKKEVDWSLRIQVVQIRGSDKISTLCKECWKKAELILENHKKMISQNL